MYFQVSIDGGAPRRTKLKIGSTLAESAHRLAEAMVGVCADLQGNLTGWYRLEQGGRTFPGAATGAILDPSIPLELRFVPASSRRVTLHVRGDREVRFEAPVSTAVPVRSLLAHLVRWLLLPPDAWSVSVDGERLQAYQTLGEYDDRDELELVVSR